MKKVFMSLTILFSAIFMCQPVWADSAKIVTQVNDTTLTLDEFNEIAQGRTDRENLLNQIIASILLAQEAKSLQLNKDPVVQQQTQMIQEQQLALFFYQKKVTEKTKVSDQELEKLIAPWERKKIRFQEIVSQTKEESDNLYKQIKGGASFENLAKQHSIGRNASTGGDIGFVIVNTNIFPEEVEKVIFKLNVGEISQPVKTREGYAIFKALEKKDLSTNEMESKKNYLQYKISKEKTDRITSSLIESLRTKSKVKINEESLKKLENANSKDQSLLTLKLAEVNETIVTLNDLVGSQAAYGNPLDSPLLKNPSFLKNMIEDKIKNLLFVQEAKRIGMNKDPEFLRRINIFTDGVLANKYAMDVLCKDITATEEEYRKFFEEHKNDPQFKNIPERVGIKHILVNDLKLADDLMARLKKGEDFAKLAKEHSIDRLSADRGGDIGFIQRGRMDQLFEEAAFSAKIGEVKKIERNNMNGGGKTYDLISVTAKKAAGANKFEDVKDIIEPSLLYKKREKKIMDHIEKLKAKAKINTNMALVNTAPTGGGNTPPMPGAAPMI